MLPLTQQDLRSYNNAKGPRTTADRVKYTAREWARLLKTMTLRQALLCVLLLFASSVLVALCTPTVRESHNMQQLQRMLPSPWQPLNRPNNAAAAAAADKQQQQQQQQQQHRQQQQQQQQQQQEQREETPPVRPHEELQPPTKDDVDWNARHEAVVEAIKHAWRGYKSYAWGQDELKPLSRTGEQWFHLGLTIVDSLDTLLLAGLKDEYDEGRDWVANHFNLDKSMASNLFEVTIRVLGGFLAVFHMTKDELFLDKATQLGSRLTAAFGSSSVIPMASVDLARRVGIPAHFNGGASSTAEVTTIQLEFSYLSKVSGDKKYHELSDAVIAHINGLPSEDGLVPVFISPNNGQFFGTEIKLGARGDSYYEYLLKQYLQTKGANKRAQEMYRRAVGGIRKHLVGHSGPNRVTFIGEKTMHVAGLHPKMDHLVCFLPGVLALGVTEGLRLSDMRQPLSEDAKAEIKLAEELMETCYMMYNKTATGMAPEIVFFNMNTSGDDLIIKPNDAFSLLRPETVESLFVMYRITRDRKYREWGWNIFQAIETHSKVATGGYASVSDVNRIPTDKRDKMESFFVAETLKYLLLLFGPESAVPLTEYVFNTEAHPLPRFSWEE